MSATHGHAGNGRDGRTPTYNSWRAMKERCLYPHHPKYRLYGGRGIRIWLPWLQFARFLADLGERPAGCHIDRPDPDGDYQPGNARWAPSSQLGKAPWTRRELLLASLYPDLTDGGQISAIPREKPPVAEMPF